jgi:hypothetical protein
MAVLWIPGGVPKIAKLPDDELARLLERITPLKTIDGRLTAISALETAEGNPVKLWNTAFMWGPKVIGPVEGDLYELAIIETHHTCGYIALFKPALGEVLSQIPAHLLPDVTHFEVLMGDTVACYSEGDGHRTVTKLYTTFQLDELIARQLARQKATS